MSGIYEETFVVKHFEGDAWLNMSIGALLRRVQTISTLHSDKLGLTSEVHAKNNTAFLLSRMSVHVEKLPVVYEKVRMTTRAFEPIRAVYSRITTFESEGGKLLCEVDSRWVLVNLEERRILRKQPQDFEMKFLSSQPDVQHDMSFKKPDNLSKAIDCIAAYSMCDHNKHINNTSYADLICDLLPLELFEKQHVSKMVLLYRSEIAIGEKFTMQYGEAGENAYYVLFESGGKKSLEGYVEFKASVQD